MRILVVRHGKKKAHLLPNLIYFTCQDIKKDDLEGLKKQMNTNTEELHMTYVVTYIVMSKTSNDYVIM